MNGLPSDKHKAQNISNKKPSRFVILSAAKDLALDTDPSLRSEPALERSEGMTLLKPLRLPRNTSFLKYIGHKASTHLPIHLLSLHLEISVLLYHVCLWMNPMIL